MVLHRDTPYLRPAIASVLTQTFRDFELLLVDNGTGLPGDALGSLREDPRVRWVRLPRNLGIPGGHNAGVAAATGEFIALLDYDDLARPVRLARQVAALRADPELGLVSSLADRIDASGKVIGREFCLPRGPHLAYTQYAASVVTPGASGRREVFRELPYRTEFPFASDLDFQARAAERWKFAVIDEVLLGYRWYDAQTTQVRLATIERSRCAIQLLTARRRAGRPEQMASALDVMNGSAVAQTWRRGALCCLAEGFPVLAAYQARRSLASGRTPMAALKAGRLALQAWRRAPSVDRTLVVRMFFTGPVRALGLRPA